MERNTIRTISPGKLIISGEHSVLYGQPALASAINLFAQASVSFNYSLENSISIEFPNTKDTIKSNDLLTLRQKLSQQHKLFIEKKIKAKEISSKPTDMFFFLISLISEKFNINPNNLRIAFKSQIPVRCGLGTSAAFTLSLIKAIEKTYNLNITQEELFNLAITTENLQHGTSSGIDVFTSNLGGFIKLKKNKFHPFKSSNLSLYAVNTGTPISTTGECVEKVKKKFEKSKIWSEFGDVTNEIEFSLNKSSYEKIKTAISLNHHLLNLIGAVPNKVNNFINEIKKEGAAAKISGAGAVKGDNAGMVLVISENTHNKTCEKYGYPIIKLKSENHGTRII